MSYPDCFHRALDNQVYAAGVIVWLEMRVPAMCRGWSLHGEGRSVCTHIALSPPQFFVHPSVNPFRSEK